MLLSFNESTVFTSSNLNKDSIRTYSERKCEAYRKNDTLFITLNLFEADSKGYLMPLKNNLKLLLNNYDLDFYDDYLYYLDEEGPFLAMATKDRDTLVYIREFTFEELRREIPVSNNGLYNLSEAVIQNYRSSFADFQIGMRKRKILRLFFKNPNIFGCINHIFLYDYNEVNYGFSFIYLQFKRNKLFKIMVSYDKTSVLSGKLNLIY